MESRSRPKLVSLHVIQPLPFGREFNGEFNYEVQRV